MANLILLLGDQLSDRISALQAANPAEDRVVLAEVLSEASHVPHHPQKILLIFAAMRQFARHLEQQGWQVSYQRLDDADALGDLGQVLQRELARGHYARVIMTHCGEYRLHRQMRRWQAEWPLPVEIRPDTRFICPLRVFRQWAEERKEWRMEYFYRLMRRRTGLLMTAEGKPVGGKWNFDADNRRAYDGKRPLPLLPTTTLDEEGQTLAAMIAGRFSTHFGDLQAFHWPVNRVQALHLLGIFIEQGLPGFGDYQDALSSQSPFLFHSLLSSSINIGLLDPLEVCQQAEAAYHAGQAPLNAVEGFIRQIIGWREYVRGVYWQTMPEYAESNALAAQRPLPAAYWGAPTGMACIREVVSAVRQYGYAHHIQRLMVTGNWALLLGVQPKAVCEWYLAVFVDAFEWVELPNTLGMALHGDGGLLASKPYAASGKYIQRQGDYCAGCDYQVSRVTEPDSCPFNSLYWHFLKRHQARFAEHPRMAMIYRNWQRMEAGQQQAILQRAEWLLEHIDQL
ncbi:deoxyribodipyrimidine photolyase [Pokkaliibacter plantistimulans]|uniref:Deoxyribodipyrimidine photolyase n=1 Tax=Pokkaliibacter plantistimulans TaxID=1635171 RepID=A0ABX5LS01_9GAMM|nr:cryptochrome/photolyase family protein [Pokkaliibacter plantistimulans]PXF29382.1 deoxyribodipyrimidine photolyase [Pokkaliibacter plantistimulans]